MIRVENLTKQYGNVCAVDRITLDIHKGEILGLLGPNGAGKTTTLRMLTGYTRPTSGEIRVKEWDIEDHALDIKRLIGYLPESAPLYKDMLTYDYLEYVADIRELGGDGKFQRIRRLAEVCGLNEVMHRAVGELSKGYRQRVGLAQAMMSDPEILILDEPTSGLDPNQIIEIRDIIRRIGKEKTVVLSTHILSEAEATCDRIVIIHGGKIVLDDSTGRLQQSAGSECAVHVTLGNAQADAAAAALGGVEGVRAATRTAATGDELHLKLTCEPSEGLMERIYACIKQTDWVLLEFHRETRTLETVFRELTRGS